MGAFKSPLVSACLAAHLKKTAHNIIQYGYPVGALAMVAAVICSFCFFYFFITSNLTILVQTVWYAA